MFSEPPLNEDELREFTLAVVRDVLAADKSSWLSADNVVDATAAITVSAVWKVLKKANIQLKQPRFGEWP